MAGSSARAQDGRAVVNIALPRAVDAQRARL
jgi:hypothetical protein